jgi:aminoacylase
MRITAKGRTGHGSQFISDTATQKLLSIVQRFQALRDAEERRLHVRCVCVRV